MTHGNRELLTDALADSKSAGAIAWDGDNLDAIPFLERSRTARREAEAAADLSEFGAIVARLTGGPQTVAPPPPRGVSLVNDAADKLHNALVRHSILLLRLTLGAVFLGFGFLKYFPGVSPAQSLVEATMRMLTFGIVPGATAMVAVATLECAIGICLLLGRFMRLAIGMLAVAFIGILSPVVLMAGTLFSGPHGAPTLEGQYVLKDIILVAAGLVVAAGTFKGGRLVRD